MSWDQDPYARSIIGDIQKLKPLGDFVLVRPFSIDEQLAMEDRFIAPSPIQMTRDGRYVANRPRGLRYGKVIACGAGDQVIVLRCEDCFTVQRRIERGQESRKWRCSNCGGFDLTAAYANPEDNGMPPEKHPRAWVGRMPLGCSLGDLIVFPQVPANEISINNEMFVMIHEEQHVWGVVEYPEREAEILERTGMTVHVQSTESIEVCL